MFWDANACDGVRHRPMTRHKRAAIAKIEPCAEPAGNRCGPIWPNINDRAQHRYRRDKAPPRSGLCGGAFRPGGQRGRGGHRDVCQCARCRQRRMGVQPPSDPLCRACVLRFRRVRWLCRARLDGAQASFAFRRGRDCAAVVIGKVGLGAVQRHAATFGDADKRRDPKPAEIGTLRAARRCGLFGADAHNLSVEGWHRHYEIIGGVAQGLFLEHADGDFFAHAHAVVIVREIVHAGHVATD